jgi:pilus assembly protein CpaB
MNKQNLGKLLGVALVVAIISTGLFYMLFAMKANSQTRTTLVVAAKALKPGAILAASDLKTIPWAAEAPPNGAYQKPEEVIGNTVFDPIGEQEPIYATHLASAKSGGGSGVPDGMRAVSVHVADSTGVFALLRGGQKVDVQVVSGRGKAGETQVRTALENLTVLSVTPQPEQSSQGFPVPVVTLLAKPAEADILAAADAGASVRLTLRNPLDEATRNRSAVSVTSVVHGSEGR